MKFGFIEASGFYRQISALIEDDEYFLLQEYLLANPQAGDVIPGTGGIRKLRWQSSGRGKRGGARVIYYVATRYGRSALLVAYAKNRKGDLTKAEAKALSRYVKEHYD